MIYLLTKRPYETNTILTEQERLKVEVHGCDWEYLTDTLHSQDNQT